jgi:hypothetical protein
MFKKKIFIHSQSYESSAHFIKAFEPSGEKS